MFGSPVIEKLFVPLKSVQPLRINPVFEVPSLAFNQRFDPDTFPGSCANEILVLKIKTGRRKYFKNLKINFSYIYFKKLANKSILTRTLKLKL
jgi:hypothetical protein